MMYSCPPTLLCEALLLSGNGCFIFGPKHAVTPMLSMFKNIQSVYIVCKDSVFHDQSIDIYSTDHCFKYILPSRIQNPEPESRF